MTPTSLGEIEVRARSLAKDYNLEEVLLTQFGTKGNGYPFVEQDARGFHFVSRDEDGSELERRTSGNAEEILYWVICDATNRAALSSFVSEPNKSPDGRREWFRRELEIIGNISPDWQKRREQELEEVLRLYP